MINAATVYAWAYFTGTAIAGRRAGEDPNLGWFLAAFAGACILALFLGSGIQSMLAYLMQVNISTDVFVVLAVLPSIAYLALLAAFVLRLPTTHAPVDDVEDEAGADGVPGSGEPATARSRRRTTWRARPPRPGRAGSDAARLRRKLRPSSTCSVGAYGPGIRKHGRPAERDARGAGPTAPRAARGRRQIVAARL